MLFATEGNFSTAGLPTINEEVDEGIFRCDEPEGYPPPLFPCYGGPGVVVGVDGHDFASVEPGVFQVLGEPIEPGDALVFPGNGAAMDGPASGEGSEPAQKAVPELAVNAGLTLTAGETAAITTANLRLSGGEPALLDMMLLSAPMHGVLVRDGFALTGGDIVTQEDINDNRLHYRHDGGTVERDSFTFATPEGEVPPTVFGITIEPSPQAPEAANDLQQAEIAETPNQESAGQASGLPRMTQAGSLPNVSETDSVASGATETYVETRASFEVPPFEPGPACPWVGAPRVAELLGTGMAVVRIAGEGRWQFSLDDGRTWRDLGPVYHGRARLLRPGDRLRFRPRKGAEGVVVLAGRPWDGQLGKAGATISLARHGSHGKGTAFADFVRSRTWELGDE
jgi:hypothetical protein